MKRSLVAGLTVGLSGLSSVVVAGPGGAQEQLEMSLSPEVAAPGEEMTAAAVDPCDTEGGGVRYMNWAVGPVGEDVVPNNDMSHLGADWVLTFEAPEAEGDYQFVASCEIAESSDPGYFYYSAEFRVGSEDPEPPDDPEEPDDPGPGDAAQPVEGRPTFTG